MSFEGLIHESHSVANGYYAKPHWKENFLCIEVSDGNMYYCHYDLHNGSPISITRNRSGYNKSKYNIPSSAIISELEGRRCGFDNLEVFFTPRITQSDIRYRQHIMICSITNNFVRWSKSSKSWRDIVLDQDDMTYSYSSGERYRSLFFEDFSKYSHVSKYIIKKKEKKMKNTDNNKNYEGKCLVCEIANVVSFDINSGEEESIEMKKTGNFVKYNPSLKLKIGSLVLVDAESGLRVARVITLFEDDILSATKALGKTHAWIIDKINTNHHKKVVANHSRLKEIMLEIEDRKKNISIEQELALLAASDPQAALLIKEMKRLQGKI